jgi:hypothetical protein
MIPDGSIWHSIQIRGIIHDTTGVIQVKVNGDTFINFTGDTRNAGTSTRVDQVHINMDNSGQAIDDWLLQDTTGSINNSWTGEITIMGLAPNGNGASSDLVGSDGNSTDNYLLVDDVAGSFSASDYAGSAVSGAKDLYAVTDITKVGTVVAVQQFAYAQKNDSGAKSFRHVMRSATPTEVESSDVALSTSAVLYPGPIRETDADGTSWTVSKVNSHQFGFKVV